MKVGMRGLKRVLVVSVVWLLVVGVVAVLPGDLAGAQASEPAETEVPDWVQDLIDREADPGEAPEAPPWVDSEELSAPPLESEGVPPLPEAEFPEPGVWGVELAGEGERAEVADGVAGPVEVAAGAEGVAGERLDVEVLERSVAQRLGMSGFVFGVSEAGGSDGGGVLSEAAGGGGEGLPAELSVDFTGFASAYGGGFVDRLQVVALPDCVLEDPVPAGCDITGQSLPTRVDKEADELVVEVDDLAALAVDGVDRPRPGGPGVSDEELAGLAEGSAGSGSGGEEPTVAGASVPEGAGGEGPAGSGGVVFGVMSSHEGETGSWGATPISQSGSWQVAPGSGEFAWSYPFDVPASPAGDTPELGMSYSSGVVDGLTNSTNTQASQAGLGWADFGNAFIERRYQPCLAVSPPVIETPDLCWENFNGTISLGGVSGPLLPLDEDHTEWAVRSDPGWKVERLTGADNDATDGEYWKVTATDGTQYFFGLGESPSGTATESAWTAPVITDHPGEPCREPGETLGKCDQAPWRWNLDRVVDPDGNVTSYEYTKETNWYRAAGGFAPDAEYVRGGQLATVAYGWRDGDSVAAARVTLQRRHRCHSLDTPGQLCSYPPTPNNGNAFPDVPNDLICREQDTCSALAPSFFSARRYRRVLTEVWADGGYEEVARYELAHGFSENSDGVQKLKLNAIGRVGLWLGGEAKLPSVNFLYEELPNRVDVDPSNGRDPMGHHRLNLIANEYGGLLGVDYGQNRPCSVGYAPQYWHDNDRDCFPQTSIDDDGLRTGVFHKYLTMEVGEVPMDGSPVMATAYEYGDTDDPDPAWAFNQGSFAQNAHVWGWSNWRGYGTTTITQGSSSQGVSKAKVRVFRGMDEDPLWTDCGGAFGFCVKRDVSVETFDESESFEDHLALAGRTLEEQQIGTVDGVPDSVVQSTLYEYDRRITHEPADPEEQLVGFSAEWAGVVATTESVAVSPGEFRERGGISTYTDNEADGLPPRIETSVERGWLTETGDERCSITTYAENEAAWMLDYPASNVVRAGEDCATGEELSVSETYYDGSTTLGEVGSRGNPTLQRAKLDGSTWAETETVFDTFGRPVEVTDPNGATATTSYNGASPVNVIPTETTVTNDLGHSAVTEWVPQLQAPLRETDPNGNVTSYGYDSHGRVVVVRLPTEQPVSSGEPSMRFTYLVDMEKEDPPVVRSRQLTSEDTSGSGVIWEESWTVYDRMLRERQTHVLSPEAGKVLVGETTYDNRGMVDEETVPQAVTGTPGEGLLSVGTWDNQTHHIYDELGRPSSEEWLRGSTVAHETSYEYGPDTVTVTGPDGAKVRETVDGLGRTVEVAEHDGSDWVTSSYTYDLADNLVAASDPEGNTIEHTYSLGGRRLTQDDPNRGTASFGYDVAGNQTSVTDGLGNEVHTIYDPLGRPVERRADSPTGDLLASWGYDEPGELGLPHSETTHTADGDWVSEVTGYDARGRSLGSTLTVPAGIPGLSGSYEVEQGYDRADRVTDMGLPAVGDLPAEWLTIRHNDLGLPYELDGLERYAFGIYDDRGRLQTMSLGHPPGGAAWMARGWTFDDDQRVSTVDAWVDGSAPPDGVVARRELAYDDAGNLAEKVVSQNGFDQRECYGYDERHRLTEAFTVASGQDCETGTPGTGHRPYEHSYTYSTDGNLLERVEGSTTFDYDYPAAGQDRPHAPTEVDGDTYTWDANGNLTERTVDSDTETFDWDIQQQLASVTGPDGDTSFVYDAGGQRLLRRTDDGATLYVAGHEVTANADGSEVTAVRSYSFGGELVATRTADGVDYLVTDDAGSVEMAIPSQDVPATVRNYDPYGNLRAEDGDPMATDRGFLGQVEDDSTNLSYLNARYYDTSIGLFISTDPIYNTSSIKTLNPYTYAAGNPTSFADPGGTSPSYIWDMERSNSALRDQNKQLRRHIKQLGSQIESLQSIIKKQARQMNRMLTHIRALESTIRQQASIITQLVHKVNQLAAQVNYWRNQAAYWRGQANYWYGRAMYWKGQAQYWQGQAFYWKGQAAHWKFTAWIFGTQRNEAWASGGSSSARGAATYSSPGGYVPTFVGGGSGGGGGGMLRSLTGVGGNRVYSGLGVRMPRLPGPDDLAKGAWEELKEAWDNGGKQAAGRVGEELQATAIAAAWGCAIGVTFGSPAVIVGGPTGLAAMGFACLTGSAVGAGAWAVYRR